MTIYDLSCFAKESAKPAMPFFESTPRNPRTMLFFVLGIIQNHAHWVLSDSCSVRNTQWRCVQILTVPTAAEPAKYSSVRRK